MSQRDRIQALLTMADRAGTSHERSSAQDELDRVLAREHLVLALLPAELARWLGGIVVTIFGHQVDMLIIHGSEAEPRTYLLGAAPLVREALRAYQHLGDQMKRAWDDEWIEVRERRRRLRAAMGGLTLAMPPVTFTVDSITKDDRDAFLYGVGERLYQLVLEHRERTDPAPPAAASPDTSPAAGPAPPEAPTVPPGPTSATPDPTPGYEGTLRPPPPVRPVTEADCRRVQRDLQRQIAAINAGRRRADGIRLGGPLLTPRPLPALVLPASGGSNAMAMLAAQILKGRCPYSGESRCPHAPPQAPESCPCCTSTNIYIPAYQAGGVMSWRVRRGWGALRVYRERGCDHRLPVPPRALLCGELLETMLTRWRS